MGNTSRTWYNNCIRALIKSTVTYESVMIYLFTRRRINFLFRSLRRYFILLRANIDSIFFFFNITIRQIQDNWTNLFRVLFRTRDYLNMRGTPFPVTSFLIFSIVWSIIQSIIRSIIRFVTRSITRSIIRPIARSSTEQISRYFSSCESESMGSGGGTGVQASPNGCRPSTSVQQAA